jgi:type I restriction enzyme, S subunit
MPNGWPMRPMGEVCETGSGSTPKAGEDRYYKDGTVPFVRIADLNDAFVRETESCVTDDAISRYRLKIRGAGTLLVAMYGASIGKLGILEVAATTNQAILAVSPNPKLLRAGFLFFYLLSQRDQLVHSGFGGAQKNLSGAFLKKVVVPVPPLPEQDGGP